jgi:KaiC/GvpD/RAD55 family RecA-like ATPase
MPIIKENVSLKYYSEVKGKKVDWLFYPYIPYGKITLIQGDPGEGKSSFILKIASELSIGGFIPDGSIIRKPVNVIYQCLEDSVADTIRPRLESYGADLGRIAFITDDNEPIISVDEEILTNAIETSGAKLLILDPIQSFLGEADINNARYVREYMNSLVSVADKTGCAVVMLGHLNKNENGKTIYRGLGSIDFAAVARSIIQIDRLSDDSNVRVIRHIKSSLTSAGSTFGFEITDRNEIEWLGAIDIDEEKGRILEQSFNGYGDKYKYARKILSKMLLEKDCSYNQIVQAVNGVISLRTLKAVKKDLGIVSVKKADGWFWHIPNDEG